MQLPGGKGLGRKLQVYVAANLGCVLALQSDDNTLWWQKTVPQLHKQPLGRTVLCCMYATPWCRMPLLNYGALWYTGPCCMKKYASLWCHSLAAWWQVRKTFAALHKSLVEQTSSDASEPVQLYGDTALGACALCCVSANSQPHLSTAWCLATLLTGSH